MTNEMKEICERDGQDCTLRNDMPCEYIEYSEQEFKQKRNKNHAKRK